MKKIQRLISLLRAYFPSKLPVGMEQLDAFSSSIISLYQIPDLPSYRRSIAIMIQHLPAEKAYVSKVFFGRSIHKAMANECAFYKIQDLKQQEKQEATPNSGVTDAKEVPQGASEGMVPETS